LTEHLHFNIEQIGNIKLVEIGMKQLAMDISAGMVMAGFVTVMTVWMVVLGG